MYSYYSFRVLFQVGSDETRLNAVLDLFAQIAREPCFDTLRTKEQLGYIVWYVQYTCAILQFFREHIRISIYRSSARKSSSDRGYFVLVQSNRKPTYLDQRIEDFLKSIRQTITEMSEEEFARHKKALCDQKLEKPKKLSSRHDRIW